MNETGNLSAAMEQALPAIDRVLADRDVSVTERPLEAAIMFVAIFVQAIRNKGAPAAAPGEPQDYLSSEWFAILYAEVDDWYGKHYPDTMRRQRDDRIFGIVMIAGTLFPIRVPATRTRPGRSAETIWLSFPDGLRDGEQPLDWVEAPPNYALLSLKEKREAEAFAAEVAGALRSIRTGLIAVSTGDACFDGLKAGILPRLRRAGELLLEPKAQPIQQAYWELQLACEAALKALLQQRTGTFKETHDLFSLYDALSAPAPAFKRDLLKSMPQWKETIALRYGQGNRDNRAECVKCYRSTLAIVAGCVRSMDKMELGAAEFEIGRVPWIAALR